MRNKFRCYVCWATLSLAALAAISQGARGAQEKSMWEDSFAGKLAEGWSWLREDPAAWRVVKDALEIRSQPGVIAQAKNVALRDAPDSSGKTLAVEVTVSNAPTEQWEQLGLMWYYSDARFVKLVKEKVDGQIWLVMGKAHPTAGQLVAKVPLADKKVRLRLVVEGQTITGYSQADGKNDWNQVGRCELPAEGAAKLTLQTHHGPSDAEHWARFERFRVLELKP